MVRIISQRAIPLSTCGERLFTHKQLYPNHDNQLSEPGRKQSYEQADKGKADGPMKTRERKEERNFYTGDEVKTNRVMRHLRSKKRQNGGGKEPKKQSQDPSFSLYLTALLKKYIHLTEFSCYFSYTYNTIEC